MHDWTLIDISVSWKEKRATFNFKSSTSSRVLVAEEFVNLILPRTSPWGNSVSVNEISELIILDNGSHQITIEMQSGDTIEIEAKSINIPE